MKRLAIIAAALALLLFLTACRGEVLPTEPSTAAPETEATPASSETVAPTEAPTDPPTESTEPETEPPTLCEVRDGVTLYRNDLGEIWASVWVAVTNCADTPLALPETDITLSVDGAAVKTIASVAAYPDVIRAGETGCYFDTVRVDVDAETAALSYDIEPVTTKGVQPRLSLVGEPQLRDSVYGGLTLNGTVQNDMAEDIDGMFCIAAVLYDAEGDVLCVLYDYPDASLPSGASLPFTLDSFMLPEEITSADVNAIEVFAYCV